MVAPSFLKVMPRRFVIRNTVVYLSPRQKARTMPNKMRGNHGEETTSHEWLTGKKQMKGQRPRCHSSDVRVEDLCQLRGKVSSSVVESNRRCHAIDTPSKLGRNFAAVFNSAFEALA